MRPVLLPEPGAEAPGRQEMAFINTHRALRLCSRDRRIFRFFDVQIPEAEQAMLRGKLAFFRHQANQSWGALLWVWPLSRWNIPKKGKALARGIKWVESTEGRIWVNWGGFGDWILSP